jgi:hypothetical protein
MAAVVFEFVARLGLGPAHDHGRPQEDAQWARRPRAQIGPFAHLRPESLIEEDAHVGNFVETKKTRMGKGSKAKSPSSI